MDFRSLDAGNPMSERFRREALQNVSQNIASLRGQKELAKQAEVEDGASPRDEVTLARSKAPEPDAADRVEAQSKGSEGGQATSDRVEARGQGSGRTGGEVRGDVRGGGASLDEALDSGALLSAAGGGGLLEDKDPATRRRKDEEARRLAHDDVPAEVLKASGDIVKGQMHPVKGPKPALREMKDIPEVTKLETAPVGFADEMDIAERVAPLIQEETE